MPKTSEPPEENQENEISNQPGSKTPRFCETLDFSKDHSTPVQNVFISDSIAKQSCISSQENNSNDLPIVVITVAEKNKEPV